ncbi:MAG TPA: serine/threonine-protein kinase, partial [Acidimicrobiales bacterium]|nr:serine/threonine-protein kinase [Acidimicrobiales bacterium]
MADALAYAHAQGVVHRDIKPDNVLLEAGSGRPMLTDFGVAKGTAAAGGTLTATGLVVGTPHYMAPEQAAGKPDVDGRADLYALGVMAYVMLSGRLPFEGRTPAEVLVKHMTQPAAPIHDVAPDIAPSTAVAVMRCLAKDPAQRWPDARAFKEALAGDEHDDAPPKLRALGVALQVLLALGLVRLYEELYRAADPEAIPPFFHDPVATLTVVVAGFAMVTALQARLALGLPWRVIARGAFRQPAWWPGWCPRSLRRPGDLWDRLPGRIRRARLLASLVLIVTLFGTVPLMVVLTGSEPFYARTGRRTWIGNLVAPGAPRAGKRAALFIPMGMGLLFPVAFIDLVLAALWLRRMAGVDLASDEIPILSATWRPSSPWQRKESLQRLLSPARRAAAAAGAAGQATIGMEDRP